MGQPREHSRPFVGDQREEATRAAALLELTARAQQIAHCEIVLLKIDSRVAVDLEIEKSRGNPHIFRRGRVGSIKARNDTVLPLQKDRVAGRIMPRMQFTLAHWVASLRRRMPEAGPLCKWK